MSWSALSTSYRLFRFSLLISLFILLISAWDAPISGDEYVHFDQAKKNIDYFRTFGEDTSALHTPISRLKHYGQSFDNITTLLIQVMGIENIYRFRHLANSLMAWLIIVFIGLTAIHLTDSGWSGLIAITLVLVSARFMGHAMNNLKDIPFAFSFIFSIYCMLRFLDNLPTFSAKYALGIILGTAFGISIRIGGLLIFAYFILFSFLWIYYIAQKGNFKINVNWLLNYSGLAVGILVLSYLLGIAFWPWAWEAPLANPLESLALIKNYPTTVRQVFHGQLFWSDSFPWYYLFQYLLSTLPVIVLIGLFLIFLFPPRGSNQLVKSIFLLIAFGFPLFYAATTGANVYGGWRQMLFVFPPLVILSSIGLWNLYLRTQKRTNLLWIAAALVMLSLAYPIYFSFAYYPYQYTFFNILQGGVKGAYGQYELDYYFTSFDAAYEYIDDKIEGNPKVVAANFNLPPYYENKTYQPRLIDYYSRSEEDWDYAVVCNTFLNPYQLQKGYWPPKNTIHQITVEGQPILAILKRESKKDLVGVQYLRAGKFEQAIPILAQALAEDPQNESVLIYLARGYLLADRLEQAAETVARLFEIYPDNEWGIDILGSIAMKQEDYLVAIELFEKNLANNYKFFRSYVNLARSFRLVGEEDAAVATLKKCLRINPFYEPAYQLYGQILIDQGELELGKKMLEYRITGNSKYGRE